MHQGPPLVEIDSDSQNLLCPRVVRTARLLALVLTGTLGTGGAPARADEPATVRLERSVYAMGTRLSIEAEGPSPDVLQLATEAAFRESERIEAACSTWRSDSSWSRLNRARGAEVALDR